MPRSELVRATEENFRGSFGHSVDVFKVCKEDGLPFCSLIMQLPRQLQAITIVFIESIAKNVNVSEPAYLIDRLKRGFARLIVVG